MNVPNMEDIEKRRFENQLRMENSRASRLRTIRLHGKNAAPSSSGSNAETAANSMDYTSPFCFAEAPVKHEDNCFDADEDTSDDGNSRQMSNKRGPRSSANRARTSGRHSDSNEASERENVISSDEKTREEPEVITELRKWAIDSNIERSALDELLAILRKRLLPQLPESSEIFLKATPATCEKFQDRDGKVIDVPSQAKRKGYKTGSKRPHPENSRPPSAAENPIGFDEHDSATFDGIFPAFTANNFPDDSFSELKALIVKGFLAQSKQLTQLERQLEELKNSIDGPNTFSAKRYSVELPMKSLDEFRAFEARFSFDEDFYAETINAMRQVACAGVPLLRIVRDIVRKFLARDVALQCTAVKDTGKKTVLKNTQFFACVQDVAVNKMGDDTISSKDVEVAFGKVLNNVKDWDGNRSIRKKH